MEKIYCSIITIGDELLIGQTIDTNSAYIAQQLNTIGVEVKRRIAVGDKKEDIEHAINEEKNIASIIILTGGLGPTADDITKPLLCNYFGGTLIMNEEVLQHVTNIFALRNKPMLEVNKKQALVPDNCTVLFNNVGTAPGMLFEKENKLFFSLPGVPFEMKYLIDTYVLNIIKEKYVPPNIIHKTLVTAGEGESYIANQLIEFENTLPNNIKLAYLPKLGIVKLRLSGVDVEENTIETYFIELQQLLKHITVATIDTELPQVISTLLLQKAESIACAESCTGGGISAAIVSITGSSAYFKGGFVTYQSQIKENILDIDTTLLNAYSEISEEVALAMAESCRKKMNSTYGLSITGHLEKQTEKTFVWIGLSSKEKCIAKKIFMFYDREKNTISAITQALNSLRIFILEHHS